LRLESLEQREMLAISLLKDVAPNAGNSSASSYVRMGNLTFFVANDNSHGLELWKTDGTSLGTEMVMDIAPGAPSAAPEQMTVFQNKLYFTANDQVHGRELWVTDGTANGTQLVIDIDNIASASPDYLTVVGNELLFSAYDPTNGDELWRFDGTTASMVQDLRPGAFGSTPYYLTNVDGRTARCSSARTTPTPSAASSGGMTPRTEFSSCATSPTCRSKAPTRSS
jgi:ELWxxDGT repeat protein